MNFLLAHPKTSVLLRVQKADRSTQSGYLVTFGKE